VVQLRAKSGKDFDSAYDHMQMQAHEEAVALFEQYGLQAGPRSHGGVQKNFPARVAEVRAKLATLIDEYEGALPPGSWPNWVLGNHDRPRIASRVGPAQARVAAMLLLTLRGTPTLYNGDELGMQMAHIPPDRVLDPFEVNVPGLGLGRDGARSPMPWSDGAYAGFSRSEPWCPLIKDWKVINVAVLENDPASMLTLHRKLLALRKQYPALMTGSYHPLLAVGDILLYRRKYGATSILVALNLGLEPGALEVENCAGTALLSTYCDWFGEQYRGKIDLRPDEGLVVLETAR
jgi:alpha-glucosidase